LIRKKIPYYRITIKNDKNDKNDKNEEANLARQAIIEKVKAGEMTRAEAAVELRKINADTKAAIAEDEATQEAIAALKACRDEFFAGIKALLTDEQAEKWDAFIARLKK
jgi:molybdopterin/thiamine biosynthesis adenylyltransferase